MKKLLLPLLIASISLVASCGANNNPAPSPVPPPEETISYDRKVHNIKNLGFATGQYSPGQSHLIGVGGCDLGFPVYVEEINQFQFYFGDTFSSTTSHTGMWRSNVIGTCPDTEDLSDGITLEEFVCSDAGYIKCPINGHHDNNGANEITKIPTGIIDVDGTIYMYYFSMHDWNAPQDNMMNYGGCIKSTDYGKTWARVYDLTWVNPECRNSKEKIQGLINEDVFNTPNVGKINIEDHYGFDATQIFPLDGKDGYIYLFCEGGYRNHGVKLGRVLKQNIEVFEEYEYFTGTYNSEGEAVYKKGKNGLAFIRNKSVTELVSVAFGEMSAFYNAYLKKWCIMTCTSGYAMMYTADKIDGPYKQKITLFPGNDNRIVPNGAFYAPLSMEALQKENGKKMYMLCSTWLPAYNPSFIEITFQ